MNQKLILLVFFYYLYIFCLLIFTFLKRKNAIMNGSVSVKHFKDYLGSTTSELQILQNHISNQFQIPVFFAITSLALIQFNAVNSMTLFLGFAFILTRLIHTIIHLGKNNVLRRATVYFTGNLIILGMWFQLIFTLFIRH